MIGEHGSDDESDSVAWFVDPPADHQADVVHGLGSVQWPTVGLGGDELGDGGLVDASAVVANYNALDRVANATGIPLEAAKEANTVALRAALGINKLA